jgi:hypothetical protein
MKLLLLSDVPPGPHYATGLLTETLCRMLSPDQLACFVMHEPLLKDTPVSADLSDVPFAFAPKPREHTIAFFGRGLQPANMLQDYYNRLFVLPRLIGKVVAFGRRHGVDRLWCVLQGQTLIRMARPVAQRLDVPLMVQVCDDPRYWIEMKQLKGWVGRSILRDYRQTLRDSSVIAASSAVMADQLSAGFGTPAVPIVGSLPESMALPVRPPNRSAGEYIIGLAGQVYASDEWNALCRALDTQDWTLNDRPVRVRYLGYNQPEHPSKHRKMCIEHLGYRPQTETIHLLGECDVLYCPYFLEPKKDYIAHTGFPSKLAPYLAAARPVFFHGPREAPASRLIETTGCGVTCDSCSPRHILGDLEGLLADRDQYAAFCHNARKAFLEHLTTATLRKHFMTFCHLGQPPESGR